MSEEQSNTYNSITNVEAGVLLNLFLKGTDYEMDEYQRSTAERVVQDLGAEATVREFVDAAQAEACLEEFAYAVEQTFLPGK